MNLKLEVHLIALEHERGPGPFNMQFTKDILEFKLPRDFKQHMIRLYDGIIDLVGFLDDFGYWINVKDARDAVKC